MTQKELKKQYFEWMYDLVCEGRYSKSNSYRKLLKHLHEREFVWSISNDANRAEDGIDLRYRFAYDLIDDPRNELGEYCTVLEMILALAIRCEETIMDDPAYGDRTAQWFWKMITNLGLGDMLDSRYDEYYVDEVIDRFIDNDYDQDGRGGLFIIKNCDYDLRYVEIWIQLCWYLDDIP